MPDNQSGASVSIQSVSYHHPGSGLILDNLSLEIRSGEFVSILGPSGCGKSTLLRLLAALEQPTQGSIQFGPQKWVPIRGFVFQEPRLLPWRTVLENVKLPLELQGETTSESHSRAIHSIERVGLTDSMHQFPSQLSGGMKMRVSVARALVFQPSLLLLDEPFSSLDESIRHSLQDDLRSLWQTLKMTIVFVTHSIAEAAYLSDRAIIFSKAPVRIVSDQVIGLDRVRTSKVRHEKQFLDEVKKMSEFFLLKDKV